MTLSQMNLASLMLSYFCHMLKSIFHGFFLSQVYARVQPDVSCLFIFHDLVIGY